MSKVMLKNVQVTWVTLIEPQGYQGNENRKWSVTVLIDKKDKYNLSVIQDLLKNTIQSKSEWKAAQKQQVLKVAKDTDPYNKYCIVKDGDKLNDRRKEEEKDIYETYKDKYVVKLGRKEQNGGVLLVDAANNRIIPEKAREIANGNICNVQLSAYCYGKGGDCGITTQLEAIQKVKDERFEAENPFEPIEGSEIEDDDTNPFDEE